MRRRKALDSKAQKGGQQQGRCDDKNNHQPPRPGWIPLGDCPCRWQIGIASPLLPTGKWRLREAKGLPQSTQLVQGTGTLPTSSS